MLNAKTNWACKTLYILDLDKFILPLFRIIKWTNCACLKEHMFAWKKSIARILHEINTTYTCNEIISLNLVIYI